MRSKTSSLQGIGPRFCPACGYEAAEAPEGPLCDHCGAILSLQGYCPICESRWRLPVGSLCPKHDVELEAEEPGSIPGPALGPRTSWVTAAKFPHSLAAAAARIRLEAEGIPTFLEGERMGSPAMYRVATDGVKLQVPAECVADARILLSQDWSLPIDDIEDDLDEPWDDPCPGPSPSRAWWMIEAVIIAALASPALIWLAVKLLGSH